MAKRAAAPASDEPASAPAAGRAARRGRRRPTAGGWTLRIAWLLLLAVVLVTLLSLLGALTIAPLFGLLGASAELVSLIHDYMLIWYLTVPLLALPMVGEVIAQIGQRPGQQVGEGGVRHLGLL